MKYNQGKSGLNRPRCAGNWFPNFLAFLWVVNSALGPVMARHWIPTRNDVMHHVPTGPVHVVRHQSPTQNIRFHVTYDKSLRHLDAGKQKLIMRKLMPEALTYFHRTFKVRPSKVSIKLQHMCHDHAYFLKDKSGQHKGNILFCKNECVATSCGPVVVPMLHLDQCRICDKHGSHCVSRKISHRGIKNKDFILYVSALQTQHCDETKAVAYASYCQQEHSLDRPIAGFANVCPNELRDNPRHYSDLLATIKHEIFHALGFSAGLYAFFRDNVGRPLTRRDKFGLPKYNNRTNLYQWSKRVVAVLHRKDWETVHGMRLHEVQMIVTPRVRREVRRHFLCSSLEGAELENQGAVGTRWTHWEKRLFENEAMTGTYTQNPVFSRITLALMEDTGWYKADYRISEDLDWGKRLGCTFAKRSCRTWMKTRLNTNKSPAPYCFQVKQSPLRTRCTHSNDAVAVCNLKKFKSVLPLEYQYFNHLATTNVRIVKDTRKFGGSVSLADYCPFYQKFTLKKSPVEKRETSCAISENGPRNSENYALERYGEKSRCVEQATRWVAQTPQLTRTMLDWGSGCYQYSCVNNKVNIIVNGTSYSCPKHGHVLYVTGRLNEWRINGTLRCPSCEEFCPGRCAKKLNFELGDFMQDAQLETSSNEAKQISKSYLLVGFLTSVTMFLQTSAIFN